MRIRGPAHQAHEPRRCQRFASVQAQVILLGLGATLYIGPYLLGVQATSFTGQRITQIVPLLVSSAEPQPALPLCYLSGALVGILGIVAVAYNLAQTVVRRPATAERRPDMQPMVLSGDDLAAALTEGAAAWLVLSISRPFCRSSGRSRCPCTSPART